MWMTMIIHFIAMLRYMFQISYYGWQLLFEKLIYILDHLIHAILDCYHFSSKLILASLQSVTKICQLWQWHGEYYLNHKPRWLYDKKKNDK